ncbi:hypothetical protein HDU97_007303 [Phlyctochytrium planicorne]|nr:hypothetical protein HDU97_007303 [Phlyctochytrium planicorne]
MSLLSRTNILYNSYRNGQFSQAEKYIPGMRGVLMVTFPGIRVVTCIFLVVTTSAWLVTLSQVPKGYSLRAEFIINAISLSMNMFIVMMEVFKQRGKSMSHIIAIEGIGRWAEAISNSPPELTPHHVLGSVQSNRKRSFYFQKVAPEDFDDEYQTQRDLCSKQNDMFADLPCVCKGCREAVLEKACISSVLESLVPTIPVWLLTLALGFGPLVTSFPADPMFSLSTSVYTFLAIIYQIFATGLHWLAHSPTTLLGIIMSELCKVNYLIQLHKFAVEVDDVVNKIEGASSVEELQSITNHPNSNYVDRIRSHMKRLSFGFNLYFQHHHMNAGTTFVFVFQCLVLYAAYDCVPFWTLMSAFSSFATSLTVAFAGAGINEIIQKLNPLCLRYEAKLSDMLGRSSEVVIPDKSLALEFSDLRHRVIVSNIEQLRSFRNDNHTIVKVLGVEVAEGFKSQVITASLFVVLYIAQIFYQSPGLFTLGIYCRKD